MRQIQLRLDRTTPRERILLAGLAIGALLYAAVSAFDYQTRQQDLYSEALADRVTARAAQSAATRARQGAPDQAAIDDMRDWGVEATNVAVAQVRVEAMLLEATKRVDLFPARVTSDGELEEIGSTQWIHADIQTELNWTPTFALFDELGKLPTGFRVVSFGFDIEPARPRPVRAGAPPAPPLPPTGTIRIGLAFPVDIAAETAP
ncbi:hypothetical protein [Brevundimonas sp.]